MHSAVSSVSMPSSAVQAIQGVGIDWTFADEGEEGGHATRLFVRLMAVGVSLGGMLITALMLGIVSGDAAFFPCKGVLMLPLVSTISS